MTCWVTQRGDFCQTFGAAGSSNSENAHQNRNSSMKRMLSRQLNLVYSRLNLLEIKCEAKRTKKLVAVSRENPRTAESVADAKELKLS